MLFPHDVLGTRLDRLIELAPAREQRVALVLLLRVRRCARRRCLRVLDDGQEHFLDARREARRSRVGRSRRQPHRDDVRLQAREARLVVVEPLEKEDEDGLVVFHRHLIRQLVRRLLAFTERRELSNELVLLELSVLDRRAHRLQLLEQRRQRPVEATDLFVVGVNELARLLPLRRRRLAIGVAHSRAKHESLRNVTLDREAARARVDAHEERHVARLQRIERRHALLREDFVRVLRSDLCARLHGDVFVAVHLVRFVDPLLAVEMRERCLRRSPAAREPHHGRAHAEEKDAPRRLSHAHAHAQSTVIPLMSAKRVFTSPALVAARPSAPR